MKQKFLSLALALALLCSLFGFGGVTAFAATIGDGSESSPFLVSSEAELNAAVEAATDTNSFIRVTDDFTASSNIYLRKSVHIDFDKHTLDLGPYLFNIAYDQVTLQNGILTGTGHILSVDNCADITVRNLECLTSGFYSVDISKACVTIDNCKFKSSSHPLWLTIGGIYFAEETKDYTVTATRLDLIGGGCAYVVSNQTEYADPFSGVTMPKVNYIFVLNGTTVSDSNAAGSVRAATPTFSGGYSEDWKKDIRSTALTYEVNPDYTVTIPEKAELGKTAAIEASNVILDEGTQLVVKLTAINNDTSAKSFTAKTDDGAELTYDVQKDSSSVKIGDTILAVNPKNSSSGRAVLSFSLPTSVVAYSGTYKSTLTFTVSTESTLMHFTISGNSYSAEKGMTFEQWVNSEYNTTNTPQGAWKIEDILLNGVPSHWDTVITDGATYIDDAV